MKRAINSYSARPYTAKRYGRTSIWESGSVLKFPKIPNFVWLAMIILAIGAFSYSAYTKANSQEQEALASYNQVATRVETVKKTNRAMREQTTRIKQNPQVSTQVAQQQLRLVRRNEVVVSIR